MKLSDLIIETLENMSVRELSKIYFDINDRKLYKELYHRTESNLKRKIYSKQLDKYKKIDKFEKIARLLVEVME